MLDFKAYLNALASAEPTPGGGSAATLVGACGAALVAMVARITLGNDKYAAVHADAVMLVERADALRSRFVAARPQDEAAFAAVVAAQKLPRGTDTDKATRTAQLQSALRGAAEAPLSVAALAADLLAACEGAANLKNVHLMSDVTCAVAFARAALAASAANVNANARYLHDVQLIRSQADLLAELVRAADASVGRIEAIVAAA